MAVEPQVLTATQELAAAAAAIYTSGTNVTTVVSRATFLNRDSSARTITVHRVPSGGAVANSNMVIQTRRLSPGETYVSPELASMVLAAGDSIHAFADSANVVTVTMSGFTE